MAKHLVDIDEQVLHAARIELGTRTIKETVNQALRQACGVDERRAHEALDRLSRASLRDRDDAWR